MMAARMEIQTGWTLRRVASLLFCVGALILLLAAAVDPKSPNGGLRRRVICIDISESVVRGAGWNYEDALRAGAAGLEPGDAFCSILFAGEAAPDVPWKIMNPSAFAANARKAIDGVGFRTMESNFKRAVDEAVLSLKGGGGGEIVIVSDGRSTSGGVDALNLNYPIALVKAPGTPAKNGAMLRIDAPAEAAPGASIEIRARGAFDAGPASPEVEFTIKNSSVPAAAPTVVKAPLRPAGGRVWEASILLKIPERDSLQIEAKINTNDPFPEDDGAFCMIANSGRPRIVYFGDAPDWFAELKKIENVEWVDGQILQIGALARGGARAVVLADTDRASLGPKLAEIEDLIKNGGGLLFAGAKRGFVASGLASTDLERSLPLTFDDRNDKNIDLFILIDASGSMAGEKFRAAREAGIVLSKEAASASRVRAAFFQQKLLPAFDVYHSTAAELWNSAEARGATEATAALREAVDAFSDSKATKKKIYIISDGLERGGKAPIAQAADCGQLLQKSGIEVFAFAVGADADREFLNALTLDGRNGRAVAIEQAGRLPEILKNEWSRDGLIPGGTVVSVEDTNSPVAMKNLPALRAAAPVKARLGAIVAASLASGEPICAFSANGRIAAFASLPGNELAPNYCKLNDVWGPILQKIAAGADRPRLFTEGDEIVVTDPAAGTDGARRLRSAGGAGPFITLYRKDLFTFRGSRGTLAGAVNLYSSTESLLLTTNLEGGPPREASPLLTPLVLPGLESLPPRSGGASLQIPLWSAAVLFLVFAAVFRR